MALVCPKETKVEFSLSVPVGIVCFLLQNVPLLAMIRGVAGDSVLRETS